MNEEEIIEARKKKIEQEFSGKWWERCEVLNWFLGGDDIEETMLRVERED